MKISDDTLMDSERNLMQFVGDNIAFQVCKSISDRARCFDTNGEESSQAIGRGMYEAQDR